jgi:hypothetical protein
VSPTPHERFAGELDRVGPMSDTFDGEAIPAVPRLHGRFRLGMHARIDVS